MALWNRFFDLGDIRCKATLVAPVPWPNTVTLSGSPPKEAIFSWTHVSTWICREKYRIYSNKRPTSNKRPPHPRPPSRSNSNTTLYHPRKKLSYYYKWLSRRWSFLQSILQKPCFVTSFRFVSKLTYYYCWKWWKFKKRSASNKRPLARSKRFAHGLLLKVSSES